MEKWCRRRRQRVTREGGAKAVIRAQARGSPRRSAPAHTPCRDPPAMPPHAARPTLPRAKSPWRRSLDLHPHTRYSAACTWLIGPTRAIFRRRLPSPRHPLRHRTNRSLADLATGGRAKVELREGTSMCRHTQSNRNTFKRVYQSLWRKLVSMPALRKMGSHTTWSRSVGLSCHITRCKRQRRARWSVACAFSRVMNLPEGTPEF